MKGEINRDWYCSAGFLTIDSKECTRDEDNFLCCNEKYCSAFHRKYPTPEQFREEYGKEYPDDGAVFVEYNGWTLTSYLTAKEDGFELIVCACTPWGKPPDDWRPE